MIDTYYNLIQKVQQENFKSDSSISKYHQIAYLFGLLYNIALAFLNDNDEKFFEKVKEENKSIKRSEIPIEYAPKLEEKLKQGEQEVARLTTEFVEAHKTQAQLEEKEKEIGELKDQIAQLTVQMEEQLNNARQGLADEVTQLKQAVEMLNGQVAQLTAQNIQLEGQLNSARQDLTEKTSEITQLKNENNNLKTKLQESENKSRGLEKNLQK